MPSIEELQGLLFQDFALENSRRGKLTVLGEYYYGSEQRRIVTAPKAVEATATGAVSEEPPKPTCNPPWCAITQITIQATLSGTLDHKEDGCGGGAPFDISATTETATCTTPELCVGSCTTNAIPIEYTCDSTCYPFSSGEDPTFRCEVILACPGEEGGDWFLSLNVDINQSGGISICQSDRAFGGDLILEVNLGVGPSGVQTFSFDDPNQETVHYDVVVEVTI